VSLCVNVTVEDLEPTSRAMTYVQGYVDIDNDDNIVHMNQGYTWEQQLLDTLSALSTR